MFQRLPALLGAALITAGLANAQAPQGGIPLPPGREVTVENQKPTTPPTTPATTPTTPTTTPAPVPATAPASAPGKSAPLTPADKLAITPGQITVRGPHGEQEVKYTTTAGYLPLKDEAGKLRANMFFIAYSKDRPGTSALPADEKDREKDLAARMDPARPVTFVFNGGPGAAAIWLHLGAVGPYRVNLAADGTGAPRPPYKLVENESTWLADTDLVFIDPVGTGYSRAADPEKAKEFYGVREDVSAVGEFIRLYCNKYQRWGSPKFLAGESYGTTRAAALGEYLQDRHALSLNGIILISTVLNFQTLQPREGQDLPYVLHLPSYAAIAWYHKKLPVELQQLELPRLVAEVQEFALDTYLPALAHGVTLPEAQRAALLEKLARYTGLPRDYLDRCNLRVDPSRFEKELLVDQRKILGRFDARVTAEAADAAGDGPDFDPSFSYVAPVYAATFQEYIRSVLRYENDLPYEILTGRVQPWNFGPGGGGGLYVGDSLRTAMLKNPHLKVFVAQGYFDLATPFAATDYTFAQLALTPTVRARITQRYYLGGHMLYHYVPSLEKLHADVTRFLKDAMGTPAPEDGK